MKVTIDGSLARLRARQRRVIGLLIIALTLSATTSGSRASAAASEGRLRFRVGLAPGGNESVLSGRLLIFMTQSDKPLEIITPNFLNPKSVWIAGVEISNLAPGKTVEIDPDAVTFPAPFSTAPEGDYQVMALLDVDHSLTYSGIGPGDWRSKVVALAKLKPMDAAPVELTLTERLPDKPALADTESVKLVTFVSPSLSAFWGRPIEMRAGVVLPPSYARDTAARYPTAYLIHGFGGTHAGAWRQAPQLLKQMADASKPEMISVFLDGTCPMGHHEFADSANNGPWGRALTTEFIPYLESRFRMDGKP